MTLFIRTTAIILIALALSGTVRAQVLWSVQGPDGQQNWLLGTVHSEDPRLLDFPEALLETLAAADRLALELVPDMAMMEVLSQAMHYPEARLHEVLEPEIYSQLAAIMEEHYGMGEPALRHLRPWAAAMTIAVPPPQTGMFMDLVLSIRARGMGKDVAALETVEEQLDFLAGMSKSLQLELLRQSVIDFPRQGEMFETLVSTYLAGDLEQLEAVAYEQMSELKPELLEHFEQVGMIQRNHVMVERALPWLEQGGLMIAVGALHLPGEDGLIELLRAGGWVVEPVLSAYAAPAS